MKAKKRYSTILKESERAKEGNLKYSLFYQRKRKQINFVWFLKIQGTFSTKGQTVNILHFMSHKFC